MHEREYFDEEYTLEEAEYLEKVGHQIEALESELALLRLEVQNEPKIIKQNPKLESTIANVSDNVLLQDSVLNEELFHKKEKDDPVQRGSEMADLHKEALVFQYKCTDLQNQLDELQESVNEIEAIKVRMADLGRVKDDIFKELLKLKEVVLALKTSKKTRVACSEDD